MHEDGQRPCMTKRDNTPHVTRLMSGFLFMEQDTYINTKIIMWWYMDRYKEVDEPAARHRCDVTVSHAPADRKPSRPHRLG